MKKVLIITHWYYPRNVPRAFRARALVNELKQKGYSVDLLVGDYKQLISNNEYDEEMLKSRGVSNKRARSFSNNKLFYLIKNIINYFIGERFLLTCGRFIYKGIDTTSYDAIISIGLPFYIHLVTALKIKRHRKGDKIYIADWSDPFYGVKDVKLAPYFKKIQKFICSQFDYNIIPTSRAVNYFKKYTNEDKIRVIPQGFNFNEVTLLDYKKNKVVTFGYAGIFYKEIRNPGPLLEFLSKLNVDFIFVLYTVTHGPIYNEILLKYKKVMGDRLQIHDLIPRTECITRLSGMDFLINIENITTSQIPSKLIDYTLARRPIISFKHDDIPEEKIKAFIQGDYVGKTNIDISKYNIKEVCKQFIDLLE
ncbi:glycosyltransferase family protein [Radiobacillus deserti]|uniref:Glycosyltransferase family 4 protein n=1 Tax=Radiobacillus deserti TaxID=2594883 RepID=A0A516KJA0_9BACI|nr:glycosyltransferase family 4 protein [Radiobacillus deserti]QDP41458.1 glycosyltransferase family 4 protein [Radiobacillus deserti]